MKRPSKLYIYGKHAVSEVLQHRPRAVRAVYLSSTADSSIRSLAQKVGVAVERLDPRKVTSMVEGNAPHQGAVALIGADHLMESADSFLARFTPRPDSVLVFLSGVQDPHNTGAIIRSAAALGAAAVILPTHKQSPITPAVVKASAGMAFTIPLIATDNPQQLLAALKKGGVRVYGLAADGAVPLNKQRFDHPALFVFGNESEGIAPYAKALCDSMLAIDIEKATESLNVAASAAIALYAARSTRL